MRIFVFIVSLAWLPHSLARVNALGYDFGIFYTGPSHPGWVYAPWVSYLFEPLRIANHDTAFSIHYTVSAVAFCLLCESIAKRSNLMGWMVAIVGLYPYLLSQELGSLTVILAWLCLSFTGSLLAGCIKCYLFGFALLYAFLEFRGARKAQGRAVDGLDVQNESSVSHPTLEDR